ncbi:UDP-4-amino-4,6-dideoxy-N-acetyl-beta-L-altrosamine N-acetyltransferase [Pseudomonas sp. nanlin1]|uniref:UDP-4-amino-4, 6-dideoxy-N-acetyl-beta-L-altrosamine N-acetyltransferase n=1 Tax=Pseudomonas sp. nanlin1 TaxID=3040605 RepID=UPI00388D3981
MAHDKTSGPRLRPMVQADLETVWAWRNHWEVRRFMYNQQIIEWEQHCRWFESASQDPRRHLMVFEVDDKRQGFASLTEHMTGKVADWGFYMAPGTEKGRGQQLGKLALAYAFEDLKLHKVCGQVLGFNEPSLRFHTRLGFRQEGVLRDQHFDGECFHSVSCFGILANEWDNAKSGIQV